MMCSLWQERAEWKWFLFPHAKHKLAITDLPLLGTNISVLLMHRLAIQLSHWNITDCILASRIFHHISFSNEMLRHLWNKLWEFKTLTNSYTQSGSSLSFSSPHWRRSACPSLYHLMCSTSTRCESRTLGFTPNNRGSNGRTSKRRKSVPVYTFTSRMYTICTPTAVNQLSERHVNVLLWPEAGLCVEKGQQGHWGAQG